ncbi:MAG TPA: hypothetical protein VGN29_09510, partial [Solirubrobacteraceae bacterium]|nr:hypothetical protein [Solirubrobacteraceae bacterium]
LRKKLRRKSALPPGFRGQMGRLKPDTTTTTGTSTMQLIRSFDVPTSDPSYVRLLNWSWTTTRRSPARRSTSPAARRCGPIAP